MNVSYGYLVKFLFMFIGILGIIFVLAILTPKIAKTVDKIMERIKPNPERVDDDIYKVRSIYDMPEKEKIEKSNENNGDVKNG